VDQWILNEIFLAGYSCSFSLFAQRKRTKRKGTFSKVFFEGFFQNPSKTGHQKLNFLQGFKNS
jgi:hypothetical protein